MYKLLIVDDNYTHMDFVSNCINWNALGFTVIKTARDGLEGYNMYKEFTPDLIITDVAMPVSDGIEMVKKIRDEESTTEIIFMSCHEDFNYVKASIDANAASYILKPINPSELKSTVDLILMKLKTNQHLCDCFLHNVLYSKHFDAHIADNLQKTLGFSRYNCMLMVKYIILDDTNNYTVIHSLENIINESFPTEYQFKVTILSQQELAIIFMSAENQHNLFAENVLNELRNNINYICQTKNLRIAAGVSKAAKSIMQANAMLDQANQALSNSSTIDIGEIYFYEDSLYTASIFNLTDLKDDISELFENCQAFSLETFMDKYFPSIKIYNRNELNQLCLSVVTITQLEFLDRNISIDQIFDDPNVIWKKIADFSTILNVKQWIKNFLMACLDYLNTSETDKYPKTVSDIKEYIDQNYAEIISASQIASTLYISSGYAKNLFKKHTQQTISEYLLDVRIKNACRLLKNPEIKVYEVQELVGYHSKAHFTEVFKRKTGKTPKEYQQSAIGD